MPKTSAGLLLYRNTERGLEVMLVHLGGPFWTKKDIGAWSIPKGEIGEGEDSLTAAHREFREEVGSSVEGPTTALGELRQRGGKIVHAWAIRGDFDPSQLRSNCFEMEWPPRSGKKQAFPEVDRAAWFDIAEARRRILPSQTEFLSRLDAWLNNRS